MRGSKLETVTVGSLIVHGEDTVIGVVMELLETDYVNFLYYRVLTPDGPKRKLLLTKEIEMGLLKIADCN